MASFRAAIDYVLKHEGLLSEDPDDPGGVTMYGISLRWLRSSGVIGEDGYSSSDLDKDGDVDADDVKVLPVELAKQYYATQWWDRYGYSLIESDDVAMRVFGFSVNMGPNSAHIVLQRAIRACGGSVTEDGKFGPKTLAECNKCNEVELIPALRSEAAGRYRLIASKYPRSKKFLNGWLNRAYE